MSRGVSPFQVENPLPDNVHAPLPSPQVPTMDEEPTSGLRQLTVSEAKQLFALQQAVEKKSAITNDVRVLVGACVIAVATSFAVFFAVRAEAQKAVDGGVGGVEKRVEVVAQKNTATQDELTRFQGEADRRLSRVEVSVARQDQKLDALLNAFKIPNPAPAPPLVLDGGH